MNNAAVIPGLAAVPTRHRALRATLEFDAQVPTLRLGKRQHVQFRDLAGWIIRGIRGSLWITQDGDIRDIVLGPGETMQIVHAGPVVIGALSDADVGFIHVRRPA